VVDEVTDNGVCGLRGDRPGLLRVLAACSRGDVEVVLVQRLDRLSRSGTLTVELMDRFGACGVRLSTPQDGEAALREIVDSARWLADALTEHENLL